ncbi:thioredoxin-like [Xyrichtys novacula]|uniref:Thioredoxin n=1 Tax=Xyrichtys novacula TaxID=13765 RepID=A0AAV1HLS3_XYRNO|nr:thioredoxin-like [Xyrichtys novacula]
MVKYVESLDEFNQILKDAGDKLVVVDFTASWCGPCQRIAPKFEAESKDPANGNVIFLKVDVDEAADVAESCKITAMPTFVFYKNGVIVHRFSGSDGEELAKQLRALRN